MKNLLLGSAIALTSLASSTYAEPIRLLSANDFEWQTISERVSFAALQGDRFSDSYQALVRLPAGSTGLPHMKTAHISARVSETRWVANLYPDGAFDILPVTQ